MQETSQPYLPIDQYGRPISNNPLDSAKEELLDPDQMRKLVKIYSEPVNVEKTLNKELYMVFWGFLNPQASLTFNPDKDIKKFDLRFESVWLSFKMSRPKGMLTPDEIVAKEQIKLHAKQLFYKSVGAKQGTQTERSLQATSIFQTQALNTPIPGMGGGLRNALSRIAGGLR